MLGWDSGVTKHPQSRASLGAAFVVAKKDGKDPEAGNLDLNFCSTRCMRRFLRQAVDDLDRRIAAVKPEIKAITKKTRKKPSKSKETA